jgi:hypothetical protein
MLAYSLYAFVGTFIAVCALGHVLLLTAFMAPKRRVAEQPVKPVRFIP